MLLHTEVKRKITDVLGVRWSAMDIVRATGLLRPEVCMAITCTGDERCRARHGERVQSIIANHLGIPVGELFGPHAWFRIAARKLQQRKEKVETSQKACRSECSEPARNSDRAEALAVTANE